ncbi:AAA family ATPase [Paenactinomyces guangxiensis]|uniref:Replication-associated recombination protein A n=1 Tax=Paenactinomyces guangxiensis TaxID=1490290 RepID=A0A7W1WN68_9BACL|nr:AAA family ATPase [Paenactinomyces guangxiensis]MBA4493002.1 AAA family ATPase [Paenactinomyces guangxiensis]MBH8590149.1 AAA family ATPase [Paenactinomyces guangxiensis]
MDLFEFGQKQEAAKQGPLAARMRPRTLDEIVGQSHIVGPGKLLRRAIEADQLSSIILYGPPGTGKTTLARVIAGSTKAFFEQLNAVTAGVADLRRVIQEAKDRLGMHGQRTVLFIDEIHRFNRSQQDALLPHVEDGTIILIGATTENPSFEVNAALLSRSRLFSLHPLSEEEMKTILLRALADKERGLGNYQVHVEEAALQHIVHTAGGDSRNAINALDLAVVTTPPNAEGVRVITLEVAEESIQQKVIRYDKSGDNHYDTVSAFIKSMRGSDPDAALYYLAKMLQAGEDPRFIARRIFIHAAEDVGMADPRALLIASSAAHAVDVIGLPEAQIPLAQAVIYIATAPKSNAVVRGINEAIAAVKTETGAEVPPHLRDAHFHGAKEQGRGKGYLYPHNFPRGYVKQQYLPDEHLGKKFYHPASVGYERKLQEFMRWVKNGE